MTGREELRAWFEEQADGFRSLEAAFREHLGSALLAARLDDARLETRTKSVDSFLDKAMKSDGRGGFKYADPRTELTDLVGGRVMVPLSADVAPRRGKSTPVPQARRRRAGNGHLCTGHSTAARTWHPHHTSARARHLGRRVYRFPGPRRPVPTP